MANQKVNISVDAVDNTTRGMRSAQNKLGALERTVKRVQTTLLGFVGLNIGFDLARGLIRASDQAVELRAKLRLMTDSTENFNKAQSELVKISKNSGASLESNITLFTRMNNAVKASGGSMNTTLGLTQALSQGLRISGASAQESASVVRQFSQAMGSGVLRGEEFNAIMENGGRVAIALADGMDTTIGKLREMSQNGELTAKKVTDALLSQSQKLAEENAKLPLTISRAFENVRTEWALLLQDLSGGNVRAAELIDTIADHFGEIAAAIAVAAKAALLFYGAKAIKQLGAMTTGLAANSAEWLKIKSAEAATAKASLVNTKQRIADAIRIRTHQSKQLASEEALTAAKLRNNAIVAKSVAISAKANAARASEALLVKQGIVDEAKLQIARQKTAVSDELNALKKIKSELQLEQLRARYLFTEKAIQASAAKTAQMQATIQARTASLVASEAALTKGKQSLRFATRALTVAETENLAAKERLILANRSLAHSNVVAATAMVALGNSMKVSSVSTTLAAKSLAVANGALRITAKTAVYATKMFQRLGAAMLGWPGIIALVAYELVSYFGDIEIAGLALWGAIRKIWAVLTNPIDALFGLDDLKNKFAEIESEIGASLDQMAADRIAVAQGYENAQDEIDKKLLAASKKITQLESNLTDKRIALDEARLESYETMLEGMDKATEASRTSNEESLAKIAHETEMEVEALKVRYSNKEDYEQAVIALEANAAKQALDQTLVFIEDEKLAYKEFYAEQAAGEVEGSQRQVELRHLANERVRELNVEAVESLRESLAEMQGLQGDYADKLRSIDEDIERDAKRSRDFLRKYEGDKRSEWQKSLDAQKARRDAIKKLDDAARLDKKTDADEILRQNKSARDDLEDLIKAETKRAKAAKDGSREQIQAQQNANAAIRSYKQATDAIAKSQANLRVQTVSMQDRLQAGVEARTKALKDYEGAIVKLDERLMVSREVVLQLNRTKILSDIALISAEIDKLNREVKIAIVTEKNLEVRATAANNAVERATGGFIPRANKVPGSGSGDKIKALLEPGEFIMRKSAVEKFGSDTMHALNRGEDDPIKRKSGGMVDENEFARFIGGEIKAKSRASKDIAAFHEAREAREKSRGEGLSPLVKRIHAKLDQQVAVMSAGGSGLSAYAKIFNAQIYADFYRQILSAVKGMKDAAELANAARVIGQIENQIASGNGTNSSIMGALFAKIGGTAPRYTVKGGGERRAKRRGKSGDYEGGGRRGRRGNADSARDKQNSFGATYFKGLREKAGAERAARKTAAENRRQGEFGARVAASLGYDAGLNTQNARTAMTNADGSRKVSFGDSDQFTKQKGRIAAIARAALDDQLDILKFATGGSVPGTGLGDTVRALLTPGEFVMKKSVVQGFGKSFFENLNSGIMPQRFANGGAVGAQSNGGVETINVNFNIDGKQATGSFPKSDATMALLDQLKQSGAAS